MGRGQADRCISTKTTTGSRRAIRVRRLLVRRGRVSQGGPTRASQVSRASPAGTRRVGRRTAVPATADRRGRGRGRAAAPRAAQ